ncbi:MAG: hypothetical protein Q7J36_15720 [Thiobacillus sp.]|nr:hypothetical protein [Thiobacillus sp.]
MDSIQIISPLIGVVLGGFLTGIGAYLRARAERKRMVGQALSDLLEVRHHVVGIEVVMREIRDRVKVPEEEIPVLRAAIDALMPVDESVHKRYDEAISLLAGIDPLLAFKMRSKNTAPSLLAAIRKVSVTSGATPLQIESFETMLRSVVTPTLDSAVLELARRHSFQTSRQIKKLVANAGQVPPELAAIFNNVLNLAAESP